VASEGALTMLHKQGIDVTTTEVIPAILNSGHTDLCPFEKLARSATSPSQLFSTLKSLFSEAKQ